MLLPEGGPSAADGFIIALLGVRQVCEAKPQKSARVGCGQRINGKEQVGGLRNDLSCPQASRGLAFHHLLLYAKYKDYFSLV